MSHSISIVLADDHEVVREGVQALLQEQPGFSVVGEAWDGLQALRLVEQLKPDVLVADVMMPGLNGLDVTRQVTKRFPVTRVVVLSMYSSESYVIEAFRNGASAYVAKGANSNELVKAIREASAGHRFVSTPFSEKGLETYLERAERAVADAHDSLTAREREVLQLAAEGFTSGQIAQRLGISPRTAETHRSNVLRKLGLRGQADLTRYAIRRGILVLE